VLHIQLYIEGQEVELYKDESIKLTQSIQNVRDIKKVFTDFTRTFSVPASKNNNKIFKHFYNYFIDGFDARRKKDAEIHINYKPFKKGRVKLEGTSLINNEAKTYKITFFGSTVTLPDLLGEDRLANLSGLSAFNFTYNDTNIQAYLTNGFDNNIGADQIDDAIIFPLITHTARLIYDSSKNEANNLYTTGSDNGVSFNQLKPALRLHAIIKAIEYKYDIEFSTDFFNTTNKAYYNLYLWLHTKAGGLFTDQESAFQVKGYQLSSTSIFGAGVDSRLFDGLTIKQNNVELRNTNRRVNFKLRYWVYPTDDSQTYNLVIYKDGAEFKRFDGLTGNTKNGEGINDEVDDIEVKNGDFSAFIETEAANTFEVELLIKRNRRPKAQAYMFTTVTTFAESPITIVKQLPDIKVIDFLTGLFKMFNLTSFVNDEGVIVVQTLDAYYASSTNTWDITQYVDTTKSQVDSPIPYRQINLGYKGTETFLAKNFKNQQNKEWGKLEFEASSKFEGNTYDIELPFEHMLFERLRDANNFDLTKIQWGWFVDEKQEASSGEPLLFYAVKDSNTVIATRNIAGTKVDITAPYMPSNSSELWSSYRFEHMEQSINFHAEFDEWAGPPNERTLFETYYKTFLVDLFDEKKRITKLNAYLPLKVTQKLSLRDALKIFDKTYRINKIDTNFETNESVLELTNLVDTIDTPVNIDTVEIDTTTNDITADTTIYTADRGNVTADGFIFPQETDPVPNTIPNNDPAPTSDVPCVVTAASIEEGAHIGEASKITFKYNITKYGKLCGVDHIDEYGFLIANASSTLTASEDIDTLKADSNITVIPVTRATGNPSLSIGIKQAIVDGLSDPATRFARFYVRTNTDEDFEEADVLSSVFSESTDAGLGATADSSLITVDDTNSYTADFGDSDGDGEPDAQAETQFLVLSAGLGSSTGYSTIPTLSDIEDKEGSTEGAGTCGLTKQFGVIYHNGAGAIPIVGDRIKERTTDNYNGGNSSFPTVSGAASGTGKYGAFAIADISDSTQINALQYNGTTIKYIVFEWSNAEVVAVYNCPPTVAYKQWRVRHESSIYNDPATHPDIFQATADGLNVRCQLNQVPLPANQIKEFKIAHTGGTEFPENPSYIRISEIDGVVQNTAFGDDLRPLYDTVVNFSANEPYIKGFAFTLLDDDGNVNRTIAVVAETGLILGMVKC